MWQRRVPVYYVLLRIMQKKIITQTLKFSEIFDTIFRFEIKNQQKSTFCFTAANWLLTSELVDFKNIHKYKFSDKHCKKGF